MPKLEGIIYKAFGNYIVLRGFAPIGDIAEISKKPESYQRDPDNQHMMDIVNYLDDIKAYFPEVTLACRADDYQGLIESIGKDNDVSNTDGLFVKGLRVLSERLPIGRDRARHAYLELNKPNEDEKLLRVDGNHRLEPFSNKISWWNRFIDIPEEIQEESDEEKKKGWITHQARLFRGRIEDKIIPFTIVISNILDADNFEAKIFHDINFKQLPLRQEASLRIISELKVFEDKKKLGLEYPLALELIEVVKTNLFSNIHWLKANNDINREYYRTTCLRIVQLLLSRKEFIEEELDSSIKKQEEVNDEVRKKEQEIDFIEKTIKILENEINEVEINNINFKDLSTYKKATRDLDEARHKLQFSNSSKYNLDFTIKQIENKINSYNYYLDNCESSNRIIETFHSLRTVYDQFGGKQYGNISLLVALVYYSVLDKAQLNSFISWAISNGVNKIITPDDLSKDSSENLINMFGQIFQSKKNEIFISMQFGDSQSELIYEKVVRAIELFNSKHSTIHLNACPIRIDRAVESSTFSIQDAILHAIKSSSLIIADLSSANINVYHEIGYAMGVAQSNNLQPNIILLYKENTDYNRNNADIDKFIGFNLRNLSQLRFKDYRQLTDGLVERLEKHYEV